MWLPGSWTDRLEDLLVNQKEFIEELNLDIEELNSEPEIKVNRSSLQLLGDKYSQSGTEESDNRDAAPVDEDFEKTPEKRKNATKAYKEGDVTRSESKFSDAFFEAVKQSKELENYFQHSLQKSRRTEVPKLFIEALTTANRIRKIILAAYQKKALIRWFQYDTNSNSGGISDF